MDENSFSPIDGVLVLGCAQPRLADGALGSRGGPCHPKESYPPTKCGTKIRHDISELLRNAVDSCVRSESLLPSNRNVFSNLQLLNSPNNRYANCQNNSTALALIRKLSLRRSECGLESQRRSTSPGNTTPGPASKARFLLRYGNRE